MAKERKDEDMPEPECLPSLRQYIIMVIVKDLPLYKGVWSYGNHGIAPASKLMS